MRSWLAGFLVFAAAYAGFVSAIFLHNWPTLEDPHLYRTLESDLTKATSVIRVFKNRQQFEATGRYRITDQSYELKNGSHVGTILMVNGNVVVLNENTTREDAQEIAEEYVALLETHVLKLSGQHRVQMLQVILIPLTILTFFIFLARWVWRLIGQLN